jgi:hypothetical protein
MIKIIFIAMNDRQTPIDLFADRKIDREKLYRETPIQLEQSFKYIDIPKQASGFTPMEEIKLEGLVARNLASGKLPWWVTIIYCFMFGCFAFMSLGIIFSQSSVGDISALWSFLTFLLFVAPTFLLCWRGIKTKMAQKSK